MGEREDGEREGWDSVSEMKELLADFKVAYATTEPRLRVDVRMFSLYLIWMSTRGCRLWSAALFGTIAPLVASAGSSGAVLNCLRC